jgi:hypothetical protein
MMRSAPIGSERTPAFSPEPTAPAPARPFDETAETAPDPAAALSEAFAKRAELVLLAQQQRQQNAQFRLDRLRAAFNARQEEHTEVLRELNALRDMALEQAKKDDEVLKKYIAMM